MCVREISVSLNRDVKLFLPHIIPHMVTPTMFQWDKKSRGKKVLFKNVVISWSRTSYVRSSCFFFFFGAYGSLPNAGISWCLRTGRIQEKFFQGGKGAMTPQFWWTNIFNRPERGAWVLSPPKYLVPREDSSPISNQLGRLAIICGIFWRFSQVAVSATTAVYDGQDLLGALAPSTVLRTRYDRCHCAPNLPHGST